MANRLASILLLSVTAFTIAFPPFALDLRTREPERERALARTRTDRTGHRSRPHRCGLSVFARERLAVVAPGVRRCSQHGRAALPGNAALGITQSLCSRSASRAGHASSPIYSAIGALVNVAVNVVLIPPLGTVRRGLATVAAFLVLASRLLVACAEDCPDAVRDRTLVIELLQSRER